MGSSCNRDFETSLTPKNISFFEESINVSRGLTPWKGSSELNLLSEKTDTLNKLFTLKLHSSMHECAG